MTQYTLEMTFNTDSTREEVLEWARILLENAPDDAAITIGQEPTAVAASDLTEADYGRMVEFLMPDNRLVKGQLQQVIKAGGKLEESVVLVVNDTAWSLTYGVVGITD